MGHRFRQPASLLILGIAAALVLAIIPFMSAQNAPPPAPEPFIRQAAAFAVSGPVSEMSGPEDGAEQDDDDGNGVQDRGIGFGDVRPDIPDPGTADAVLQIAPPSLPDIPTSLSFDGLSSQDNFNIFGARLSPPDTNGDVGPNHYVQTTNTLWRVWDKSGNPLTAPLRLSGLFAPIGPPCSSVSKGDPIVEYDPLADRWLISQLGFLTTSLAPPYFECIAISQTPDPTGAYFLYAFQTADNEFPDYPKLGVWPDGYYMTVNQFTNGGPFNGTGAYAFDRAKMLAGDPTASYIYFSLSLAAYPEAIGGMLPSDFDGLIPPPAGSPNTFAYFTSLAFGGASDALRLFDFHADFVNPVKSTFSERAESPVPVAAFNPSTPAGRADIQQPGTTIGLDSIPDRLMHRLQYRNLGNIESLVATHTVGAPASTVFGTFRAGVRYYQLKRGAGPFTVTEQATYAPADGLSRWMGSVATDNQGNLAVGFSTSSSTSFPSAAYAGRLVSDPPGGLFQGENSLVAGTGVQTGSNRWGDYSAMMVDPADDCTFWYTNEYYTAASQASSPVGWQTRIGRFKFQTCTPPPQGTLQGLITNASGGAPVSGASIQVSNGYSAVSASIGSYSRILTPGTYHVTVSRLGYQPVTIPGVFISNGNTTTLNVALEGTAAISAGTTAVTAENFSPANGAIDAGETVTVNFTLLNIGAGATTDLVATLLSSGGVLTPSAPQHYGAIGAGGSGTQAFSFRADPLLGCGGKLTASIHVLDGAHGEHDLGTIKFGFQLAGNLITIFSENFDGVNAPALPAGWVASNPDASPVLWVTSATSAVDSPPNVAFVAPPAIVSDKLLDSPAFLVRTSAAQLTFRHAHTFQTAQDGGVLEISIDGNPFADILAAGGSFVTGGYNTAMTPGSGNPLAGRNAWSGTLALRTTTVNLPAAAAGKMVKLRWRMGSDTSVASPAGTGWSVDSIAVTELLSACTYNVVAGNAAVHTESFLPGNGAIDAGETVTVDLTLRNTGTASTTNLVATLLSTGGVLDPGGPQNYGVVLPGGGFVTRTFSFRADPLLGCGGALTATLHLQEGSTDLGTVSYNFLLAGNRVTVFSESFDGVTAPVLPAGWVASKVDASPTQWVTDTLVPDTPPNDAFINGTDPLSDKRLDSPAFLIRSPTAQLTFRHWNITQTGFDGGVLEISVDGGAFTDILTAGGSFVLNGYDGVISTTTGSPLAGRPAWTTAQTGYRTTVVNLPAATAGKNVKLRWRYGSDNSVTSAGWRVETVTVSDIVVPCSYNFIASGTEITAESFVPANGVIDPGENVSVNFTLKNTGTLGTSSTVANLLSTGGVTNPSGQQTYGALAGNGGTATKSFAFRADPALICGGPLVATQQLFENGVDLGTVKFNFTLGAHRTTTRFADNFDSIPAPLLPAGWAASSPDASPVLWVTSAITPDTPPNDAFIVDPAGVSDSRLDSPAFTIQSEAAQLTFRNNYNMDLNFDGGVLEISLDGAPFTDILTAGGSFAQGGYNGSVTIGELNPLDGRRVWTGNSNGYITTVVNLPSTAAGKVVKLRWRMGSGLTVGGVGWRVDSVTVADNVQVCAIKSNTTTTVTSNLNPSIFGQPLTLTATVRSTEAGAGTPTGSVTLKDGEITLGTLSLNGFGQASGTGTLDAGSHSITASYNGDEDFKSGDSPVLTQTIETATPTN